jgi:CheY-like chemotaxis protein
MTDRVLILDDEPDFVAYVQRVAEDLGHDAHGTTRAAEFKRAFDRFHPSLIVLDMVVPEMDGFELSRWLAQQGYAGRLLLVTGYTPHYATGARAIAQAHGLDDVRTLKKPVRLNDLKSALSEPPT